MRSPISKEAKKRLPVNRDGRTDTKRTDKTRGGRHNKTQIAQIAGVGQLGQAKGVRV